MSDEVVFFFKRTINNTVNRYNENMNDNQESRLDFSNLQWRRKKNEE